MTVTFWRVPSFNVMGVGLALSHGRAAEPPRQSGAHQEQKAQRGGNLASASRNKAIERNGRTPHGWASSFRTAKRFLCAPFVRRGFGRLRFSDTRLRLV